MMSFIGWLLGSSAVPSGPLVWVTGGVGIAVALTILLLATLGVIAWHHEPLSSSGETTRRQRTDLRHPTSDRHLPKAA